MECYYSLESNYFFFDHFNHQCRECQEQQVQCYPTIVHNQVTSFPLLYLVSSQCGVVLVLGLGSFDLFLLQLFDSWRLLGSEFVSLGLSKLVHKLETFMSQPSSLTRLPSRHPKRFRLGFNSTYRRTCQLSTESRFWCEHQGKFQR